jgi:hypothetical protein
MPSVKTTTSPAATAELGVYGQVPGSCLKEAILSLSKNWGFVDRHAGRRHRLPPTGYGLRG